MSTEMQTKMQASPVQNFAPVQTGILQRKCALCNTPGLVENPEQDKEKLTLQRSSVDQVGITTLPRFRHDFSRVSVHSTGPGMIQTKLKINKPGDLYEQEADKVAEQVMLMEDPRVQRQLEEELVQKKPVITPLIQRQTEEEDGEEILQPKELPSRSNEVTPALSFSIQSLRGGGQALPESVSAYFEPHFGHDFSQVRVHTDGNAVESAKKMNALAYTMGRNIVFGAGQYQPGTTVGRRLLAHELTHVVQQSPDAVRPLISSAELAVTPLRVEHRTPKVGALIQRAIKCSLDHIEKECKGAASSCMSVQESYCKDKYPTPEDIKTLHTNAVTAAETKKKNLPHAADNFLHFLGASGTEKVMPVKIFQSHKSKLYRFMSLFFPS